LHLTISDELAIMSATIRAVTIIYLLQAGAGVVIGFSLPWVQLLSGN